MLYISHFYDWLYVAGQENVLSCCQIQLFLLRAIYAMRVISIR